MVKPYLLLICGLVVLAGRDGLCADAQTLNAEQIKQFALFAPKPYFPSRARREYKTGAGAFLLNVNPETGLVSSIKIDKTTGLWSFDVSCLKTFIKWRFKPHMLTKVRVPVRFVFGDGKVEHPATW
jgi:outer membrane biosynthesis protein TonB